MPEPEDFVEFSSRRCASSDGVGVPFVEGKREVNATFDAACFLCRTFGDVDDAYARHPCNRG